jgi:hypothetical protein
MPPLQREGLRDIQVEAILGLEKSFAENRSRTLVPMTMGAGKTYVAVAEAYRLIRFAGARRIFFMVDRRNLGKQALREFQNYIVPDENRKFGDHFAHINGALVERACDLMPTRNLPVCPLDGQAAGTNFLRLLTSGRRGLLSYNSSGRNGTVGLGRLETNRRLNGESCRLGA